MIVILHLMFVLKVWLVTYLVEFDHSLLHVNCRIDLTLAALFDNLEILNFQEVRERDPSGEKIRAPLLQLRLAESVNNVRPVDPSRSLQDHQWFRVDQSV